MIDLSTRWSKKIDKNNILKEYPRPHLMRDSYYNLNGEWEYAINNEPHTKDYTGSILVPFSPESSLSGVGQVVMPDEFLHYRKIFSIPAGFCKERVIIHFGAVDQECQVFLNGIKLGIHVGGYLPFSFDVTKELKAEENVLTLSVTDKTEQSPHARGKQKLVKKGKFGSLFYTPNSGIWKTVWLESVPQDYVTEVKITPLFDQSKVRFQVFTNELSLPICLKVLDGGNVVAEAESPAGQETDVILDSFIAWTPDQPHLYDVKISCGVDIVNSYFGMRKFSRGKDQQGIWRFYLNNRPFFFNGVLDQGYWPDGLMTAPSDEALIYDIKKMKELGYNTIRKHIKIESERFYYHCDRLGMAVWQDMPNGGGDYNMLFVTYLPNASQRFARLIRDHHYSIFKRRDKAGRKQYYEDLQGMIRHLYHYPSIAAWVPFNEGWGQFDAPEATKCVRVIDNSRLINEACGWFDQKGGDMYSIHNYTGKLKVSPQKDRVVALTEFGGYAYPVLGHMACEKVFGYQHYDSSGELTVNYQKLIERMIYPNLARGLSSAIYTQLSDIEEEINGLVTYDREIDKMQVDIVKAVNQKLYEIFESVTAFTYSGKQNSPDDKANEYMR